MHQRDLPNHWFTAFPDPSGPLGLDRDGNTPWHHWVECTTSFSQDARQDEPTWSRWVGAAAVITRSQPRFDIDRPNHRGETPLEVALKALEWKGALALLELGANPQPTGDRLRYLDAVLFRCTASYEPEDEESVLMGAVFRRLLSGLTVEQVNHKDMLNSTLATRALEAPSVVWMCLDEAGVNWRYPIYQGPHRGYSPLIEVMEQSLTRLSDRALRSANAQRELVCKQAFVLARHHLATALPPAPSPPPARKTRL